MNKKNKRLIQIIVIMKKIQIPIRVNKIKINWTFLPIINQHKIKKFLQIIIVTIIVKIIYLQIKLILILQAMFLVKMEIVVIILILIVTIIFLLSSLNRNLPLNNRYKLNSLKRILKVKTIFLKTKQFSPNRLLN